MAVAFDFNGTLSDDEPVLLAVYQELFAEHGRPLTEAEYYARLAGHNDEEMLTRWLGVADPALVAERVARYVALVADGSTVDAETRAAVRFAAECGPVAIVSAATRHEIEVVVAAAGLGDAIAVIVSQDDVRNGKPDPECYLTAARELGVEPTTLLVFEDTEVGLAAARAAGARAVGLTRTVGAERMAAADELAERIDVPLLERLLCS
jgi:beta-phosphoglucomutase-like phosphatase (HAD superfamily)